MPRFTMLACAASIAALGLFTACAPSSTTNQGKPDPAPKALNNNTEKNSNQGTVDANGDGPKTIRIEPREIEPFMEKSLAWLAKAQHSSGGWGAGSHAAQQIRDPHAVKTDPATTAFAAMALMRAGSTPNDGPYKENVEKALMHIIELVDKAEESGPLITDMTGTQPQQKLGRFIDTSMAAQFLARALPHTDYNKLVQRKTEGALDKC
ncbi:MAG: hypothetical protein KDB07_10460, partial [Planctomycetes bacterium]|nr:hypothetical protein [Planctomycetota bacterium]